MNKLILFLAISVSFSAVGFEYDVEWPTSNGSEQTSTVVITIDGCKTQITMKNTHIKAFDKPENLTKAVKLAIERAESGCSQ